MPVQKFPVISSTGRNLIWISAGLSLIACTRSRIEYIERDTPGLAGDQAAAAIDEIDKASPDENQAQMPVDQKETVPDQQQGQMVVDQ
ncbi:hypothetical protein AB8880_11400 [Alphaproteobacteria bacterium LSUCC0684]